LKWAGRDITSLSAGIGNPMIGWLWKSDHSEVMCFEMMCLSFVLIMTKPRGFHLIGVVLKGRRTLCGRGILGALYSEFVRIRNGRAY
jgi:hypothetical protein